MEADTENRVAWPEAKEPQGTVRGRDTLSPAASGGSEAPRTPDFGLLRFQTGREGLSVVLSHRFSSVQLFSRVQLFATP